MNDEALRLHLGCGFTHHPGWVNIDAVASFQPDVLHDVSQPLPYDDLSVDEILAEDILEHFDKYQRYVVFYDWSRVLKIGGCITLQVPNFKKILFRYFKFGYDNFVDFIFGENLLAAKHYIGHYGNHKWGYSRDTLKDFVKVFGIETTDITEKGLNIRLVGKKQKHVRLSELDEIAIPSVANRSGEGQPEVSLQYARKKIQEFSAAQPKP